MAGGIAGIIQDIRARQMGKQRTDDAMMRMLLQQQEINERAKQAAALRQMLQQNSPATAREKRLQEAQNLREQRDLADLNYMLQVDPNKLPPTWRPFLAQLKANPDVGAAKQLMRAYKPGGMKYMFKDTLNPDGTVTSNLYAVDPDTATVLPTRSGLGGASSATPGAAAVSAPAAAPPSRRTSSGAAADHFYNKIFGGDSGGP